jgi:hypothetical protein
MSDVGAFSKADSTAGDEAIVEPALERFWSKFVKIELVAEDTVLTKSTSKRLIGDTGEDQ